MHSCGPLGGYLSPFQSQATAFTQSRSGDLHGGVGAGADSDLSDHLSLQRRWADRLPLFPRVFSKRLESSGDHLSAGVWVPGACSGCDLLFSPDHLGTSAVRPAQRAEPGLCEDHLQQSECLPGAFHPQPPGHPPAVPGEINGKFISNKLNSKVKLRKHITDEEKEILPQGPFCSHSEAFYNITYSLLADGTLPSGHGIVHFKISIFF